MKIIFPEMNSTSLLLTLLLVASVLGLKVEVPSLIDSVISFPISEA